MRNYKELLESGNKAQLEKLKENEHKKGFDNIDIFYAIKRIKQETRELRNELFKSDQFNISKCQKSNNELNYKAVRHEAADVANFAHMIILACDKELNRF